MIKFLKYIFHISVLFLIIISLYPGSLLGYFFYGDLAKQPDLIPNPIGTSINHALAFLYLSMLGLISYMRNKNYNQFCIFLISLSIILELFHYFIPNRSFEFLDLFGNLIGTLIAIIVIISYKKYKEIL